MTDPTPAAGAAATAEPSALVLPPAPAHPRRLVYLGTPELAVQPLAALHEAGFDVALVVSQPDKRRGRGAALSPSPVKQAALDRGIPVSDSPRDVLGAGADLAVVVAYGRIIATDLLRALPMVNIHFSLLPRWRGAAPVERAILAGDTETGVCLMVVAPDVDSGAVYASCRLGIGPEETLDELRGRLVEAGTRLLVSQLRSGLGRPEPQVGEPVLAVKIDPAEHRLHFDRPAVELHRVIRLGRAWCELRGRRLKILRAALEPGVEPGPGEPGTLDGPLVTTGAGRLRLVEVQPEGKPPMAATAWLNGAQLRPGEHLA